MELKTQISLGWHTGIPDGDETYSKIFDFSDDPEVLKEYALLTAQEAKLASDPDSIVSDNQYLGYLTIWYGQTPDHYRPGEFAAEVTVEHFLKAGNTHFKLEAADITNN